MFLWRQLLHRARGLYIILVFLSLINISVCIYEDQIGKFDWRQTYVGRIKFARFDTLTAARRIIVATEENVLAALNLKTGEIVWRHVLERASAGEIHLLHVGDSTISTVSGENPYLVRGWDTATGLLLWEWSLTVSAKQSELSQWFVHQGQLYHALPVPASRVEITSYNIRTGTNRGQTLRLSASWVNDGCVLSNTHYICVTGDFGSQFLFSIDLINTDAAVVSKPLSKYVDWSTARGILNKLDGFNSLPGFLIDSAVAIATENDFKVLPVNVEENASITIIESFEGTIVLQTFTKEDQLHVKANRASDGEPVLGATFTSSSLPGPALSAALCTREQHACRLLVTSADDSVTLFKQKGEVAWHREEALANIVAVEFIDLPVSELEAAIETEFATKEGDIFGGFVRRVHSQMQQLATFAQNLAKLTKTSEDGSSDGSAEAAPLVRDDLDLHKMILAVTKSGKIFGIDNLSGAQLWSVAVPRFSCERGVSVYVQRSARQPPHEPQVTVVASQADTGYGLLVSLNPIAGKLSPVGVVRLDYRLKQAAMLPTPDSEHLKAIVLLDQDDSVQVLPISSSSLVQDFYIFVADRDTTKIQGYALKFDGREVNAIATWSVTLGGSEDSGHRIVRLVGKRSTERVHSHGKVMGDRSVLYKYINPNLLLAITEGPDPVHKDVVHAFLLDAVSGAVVAAQSHKRARATPHAVHADNLAAYAYYNDKQRRTEIATLELYEGATRALPAGAAFSSLAPPHVSPLVERQTYIVPGVLTAMVDTFTERGITDKHVLLALTNGQLIEMPWAYLDPRRPTGALTQERREEGLVPYAPELPLPAEAAVNYNRTISVRGVHTAPSGLESTCLVLAYGPDIFYTRVAPSKTFDLLKDDFDYYLITLVLGGLILATYSTKYFASRKMLRQAWK